jgi:hypothetical protein
MIWTDFAIGVVVCIAITLTLHVIREWRQRSAYIVGLSPPEREALSGFEAIKGDWRAFRALSQLSD